MDNRHSVETELYILRLGIHDNACVCFATGQLQLNVKIDLYLEGSSASQPMAPESVYRKTRQSPKNAGPVLSLH
jgi:hypothetical protein